MKYVVTHILHQPIPTNTSLFTATQQINIHFKEPTLLRFTETHCRYWTSATHRETSKTVSGLDGLFTWLLYDRDSNIYHAIIITWCHSDGHYWKYHTSVLSSIDLQWLHLKMKNQGNSCSNSHQGDTYVSYFSSTTGDVLVLSRGLHS